MEQHAAAMLRGSTASQPPPEQHTSPTWAGQLVGAASRAESNHTAHELKPPGGLQHPDKRASTQGPSAASSPPTRHQPAASNCSMHTGSNTYIRSPGFHCVLAIKPRSLLDLPAPWLMQLIMQSDWQSLQALFRTCVPLRNLILRHARCIRMTLLPMSCHRTFSLTSKGRLQSLKALQLADQHGSNLKLHSTRCCGDSMLDYQVVADYTFTVLRMAHTVTAVTQLVLHEVVLEMPLMPWLSDILPDLTTYTLSNSFIEWPSTSTDMDSSTAAFTNLQSLEIIIFADKGDPALWREHLKQQFKHLTALKRLALAGMFDEYINHAQEVLLGAALPSSAQQLTTLTMEPCVLEAVWPQVVATQFGALQELQLCGHSLTDQEMPWLLGMPHLKWLEVGEVCLDQSWAGQPCGWRELYCAWCSTEQLTRLPLHSNLHLKGSGGHGQVGLELGCDVSIQAAITAVTNTQLPAIKKLAVWYASDDYDSGTCTCLDHRLKQAAPLLVNAKYVSLPLDAFTVQGVLAWLDARPTPQQAICLQLCCVSKWPVLDVEQLFSSIPAGISIMTDACGMESLVDMCCLASHGITLHVMLDERYPNLYGKIAMQPDIQAQVYKRGKQDIQVHAHTLPSGLPWKRCVTAQHITAGRQPSSQRYASACTSLSTIMGCILEDGPKRFVG